MKNNVIRTLAMLVIFSCFSLCFMAASFAQELDARTLGGPTGSSQQAILITTVAGFASLLATHFFQIWRESRNRRWDLQDRAAARLELKRQAQLQRVETIQTAVDLAKVSTINKEHLLGELEKNTEITREARATAEAAFASANDFNTKLAKLHEELAALTKDRKEA